MNKEKYLELRNGLYTEAEALINEGKLEEGQAKMADIEKLDNDFENSAKALANLNALKDSSKISNIAPVVRENKIGEVAAEDLMDSIEYRKAFMNHVISGEAIPSNLRNANTTTKEIGTVIPNTVLNRIIEKIEASGMILPLVTRTNYKGGLTIPTSNLKPKATWVAEGTTSELQSKGTASITFAYHKLRCAISMTLEASVVSLEIFEATFVNQVSEAMLVALETAIMTGEGANQPKGILHSENLTAADTAKRVVTIASNKAVNYQTLTTAEGLLDLSYENGAVWFMSKKQFMEFAGMVDSAGQPVARVTYGIGGAPERTLLGRRVVLNNYMPTTASASLRNETIVAFLVNPSDYILNTNLQFTMKRYENNETDDQIVKCVGLFDGQLAVKDSLVLITKAATA